MAHQAGAYPSFSSLKQLGVFLLPPGWDASPSQGYPQHCFCWYPFIHQAPVVRKRISANPRLNRPNPRNKFVLRLNFVPRSSISTIQGLNYGLNLTHLARWINLLIGWKSSQTNQNGGLTLCRFCFNHEPGWGKKRNSSYLMIFPNLILPILSRTSQSVFGFPALFRVSHRGQTAVRPSALEVLKCFTRRGRSKKFQHFRSQR